MPQSIYYRGDAKLMEIMTNALTASPSEKKATTTSKSKKKRKIEKTTKSTVPFRSDQFYKIPFCIHGSFSKKLGILNTELQLMRSSKDTIIFLLWNDDIYFPSQTLVIVGSLAISIQSKTKDPMNRDGFCVLELTEDGLLDGFVVNIEMGDGFLIMQTREHTLYGLGDNTICQLGFVSKNQNFYHEIIEIPFEHGQLDFIKCGSTYSVVFTKSREIYMTGEYEHYNHHSPWTRFLGFDDITDKSCTIIDCQPGIFSMYCLIKPISDVYVHHSYIFDWHIGSIKRCGYFQQIKERLQQGQIIQRIESCSESFLLQFDDNEWYWVHFILTDLGSFREFFVSLKSYLPISETYQYEIQNVCGSKTDPTFMVTCKIISADNHYNVVMEPYMIFHVDPMQKKAEKIECPFYGRAKWAINNSQMTQFFSLLIVNEEPSEWFMKRLLTCEKWRDVTISLMSE